MIVLAKVILTYSCLRSLQVLRQGFYRGEDATSMFIPCESREADSRTRPNILKTVSQWIDVLDLNKKHSQH